MYKHCFLLILRVLSLILYCFGFKYSIIIAMTIVAYPRHIHKRLALTKRMIRLMMMVLVLSLGVRYYIAHLGIFFPELIIFVSALILNPVEKLICRHYYEKAKKKKFNGIIIGITGSYGKTSAKSFINQVLSTKYNVLMTPKSFNTPMGIAKTINDCLNDSFDFFLCEMGASKKGDIDELMDLVKPDYGVITSIGIQHLKTFGNEENIYKEKIKILDNKTNINFVSSGIDISKRYLCFGDNGDVYAKNIKEDIEGLDFIIVFNDMEYHVRPRIHGKHNVSNVLCSFLVGIYFGVPINRIIYAINNFLMVDNRLNISRFDNEIIIDDSFNSNPIGAMNALEVLEMAEGKKCIITPGFVELGRKNYDAIIMLAKKINEVCDYKIIVKNKALYKLIDNGIFCQSFEEAIKHYRLISARKALLILNDLPDNY